LGDVKKKPPGGGEVRDGTSQFPGKENLGHRKKPSNITGKKNFRNCGVEIIEKKKTVVPVAFF